MRLDEKKAAAAAAAVALAGIALLFLLSETPSRASVAEALVAKQNSLLEVSGTVGEVSSLRFTLCDHQCISVRHDGSAEALLLYEGRMATVIGRVKEYRGSRYLQAAKAEAG